jgi:hypothetical protein
MTKSTRMMPETQFVAESLENLADALPQGESEQAHILRNAAMIYRQLSSKRLVYVHEDDQK